MEEVPADDATVTSTVPAEPGGALAVSEVEELMVRACQEIAFTLDSPAA
jgi:hypothetical protein